MHNTADGPDVDHKGVCLVVVVELLGCGPGRGAVGAVTGIVVDAVGRVGDIYREAEVGDTDPDGCARGDENILLGGVFC